jgi:ubiquinone/menaquinone biosynthesis C-methylase UbiE
MTDHHHNRDIQQFFNQSASTYARQINTWITRKRADFIRTVARGRVLDVGVGPGQLARLYSTSPLVAMDISLKMVGLARERLRCTGFVVGDAEELPFRRGSFDTVIGSELFYYLADPRNFLRDVRRVLAPGGRIVLLWGNPTFNGVYRVASLAGLRPNDPLGLTTPSAAHVLAMLTAEFRECRMELHGIGLPLGLSKLKAGAIRAVSPVSAVVAEL